MSYFVNFIEVNTPAVVEQARSSKIMEKWNWFETSATPWCRLLSQFIQVSFLCFLKNVCILRNGYGLKCY